jgi:small-conductance mechanosensitive channel
MDAWEALVTGATWEPLLLPLAVAATGWLGCALALWLVARASRRADSDVGRWPVKFLRRPLQLLAATVLFRLTLPVAKFSGGMEETIRHVLAILLILGTGWLLIALTSVLDEFIDKRFVIEIRDNLTARRVHTKFLLLRRVLVIIVGVVTGGALLMTFPAIRQLGAGLLASAGIVGIVLGIAARPTLEMLIAGVQLALTEPIRLDDVVIVEGEWGRIEEINATHVAIRIWDDRRLIVPVSYFLTQPFQNWTRVTADVTGQVSLEVDYTTPVEEVRAAAGRIVEASPHWDRRFWNLQVVEAGERTIRLRVLASAGDSSSAWSLRCEIREKLIGFLQERHPEALPRLRAAFEGGPTPEPARSAREIATQASAKQNEREV